ncbi:MAG: response regulator [Desulfobacteraceae bacterium]|uniref:Response regulator n=1 Tax=Candidatus Desulfaltia bathyphila TaxID=2841697 RepID=A0A8J6N6X5_9BACT|nr:response regulator [Candidatus Desulfaltia bathyphila]MBL7195121.1 response regulator [Desulfobacterales bacterium]
MKAKILIVDDEEKFVNSLAERLSIRDYDATTSVSGQDAIEKVSGYNFDVVMLDVVMPGMDGLEVLREIKRIKPLTEVIMLTALPNVEIGVEAMKRGALDYILKPCEIEELISKIDRGHARKTEQEERISAAEVSGRCYNGV